MTATTDLLLCAGFLFLNAIFVAAEFALIASPRPTLEHRASQGDHVSRRLLDVILSPRRQDRYVATAQLGITIASLGLGMYGEHRLAIVLEPWLGRLRFVSGTALAAGVALGSLTVLHIVLGEMVPKGVALQHPERVARVTRWPMQLTLIVFYPVVAISSGVARLCLRLVGIRRQDNVEEQLHTPEELRLIVEESERGGALQSESGRILRELFEFGDLTAAQVMTPRVHVEGIPVGATAAEVTALILKHQRTRYAVYDGDLDHIIGTLHVKDLLRRLIAGAPITAADARRIPVVPETASLDDVLGAMQRGQAHMALVIDEHGGSAGIVSLEDLFEEVVGELDEGAPTAPSLTPLPDGAARAAGTLRLDELGQHFNVEIEHDEVDSVSGLVLAQLGRPPVVGDTVDYGRLHLEVTAISGRGVQDVIASLTPAPAKEP